MSEDGEEWVEEVRVHCERCYDDKEETVPAAGEEDTRTEGRCDGREAWTGKKAEFAVDKVASAEGK